LSVGNAYCRSASLFAINEDNDDIRLGGATSCGGSRHSTRGGVDPRAAELAAGHRAKKFEA